MRKIQLPDGTILEFPDGVSEDVVRQTIRQRSGTETTAAPQVTVPQENRIVPPPIPTPGPVPTPLPMPIAPPQPKIPSWLSFGEPARQVQKHVTAPMLESRNLDPTMDAGGALEMAVAPPGPVSPVSEPPVQMPPIPYGPTNLPASPSELLAGEGMQEAAQHLRGGIGGVANTLGSLSQDPLMAGLAALSTPVRVPFRVAQVAISAALAGHMGTGAVDQFGQLKELYAKEGWSPEVTRAGTKFMTNLLFAWKAGKSAVVGARGLMPGRAPEVAMPSKPPSELQVAPPEAWPEGWGEMMTPEGGTLKTAPKVITPEIVSPKIEPPRRVVEPLPEPRVEAPTPTMEFPVETISRTGQVPKVEAPRPRMEPPVEAEPRARMEVTVEPRDWMKPVRVAGKKFKVAKATVGMTDTRTKLATQMGPGGKAAGEVLDRYLNKWEKDASKFIAKRRGLAEGLSKEEKSNVIEVMEGEKPSVNSRVADVAADYKKMMTAIFDEAKELKIDVGYIEKYFPHTFKGGKEPAQRGLSFEESLERPNPHLEKSRIVNKPDWIRELEVLDDYAKSTFRSIAEVGYLGKDLGKIREAVGMEDTTPAEVKYIKAAIDRVTGREEHPGPKWLEPALGGSRRVAALLKLPFAVLYQPGQFAHTSAYGGFARSVKATVALAKNYKGEELKAIRSGALWPNISYEVSAAMGGGAGRGIMKGFLWGIPKVDGAMRIHANTVGRFLVNDAAKGNSKAVKELKRLKIKLPEGEKPGEKMYDRVGKALSDKTQFRTGTMDLPLWMHSPMGRMSSQFTHFMYRHAHFVSGLFKEAGKGDIKPLAKWLATAVVIGEFTGDARALLRDGDIWGGDNENTWMNVLRNRRVNDPGMRLLQNLCMVGGAGYFQTIVENIGSVGPYRSLAETAAGPVISTVGRLGETAIESGKKGEVKPFMKELVRQIPAKGPEISDWLYPKRVPRR